MRCCVEAKTSLISRQKLQHWGPWTTPVYWFVYSLTDPVQTHHNVYSHVDINYLNEMYSSQNYLVEQLSKLAIRCKKLPNTGTSKQKNSITSGVIRKSPYTLQAVAVQMPSKAKSKLGRPVWTAKWTFASTHLPSNITFSGYNKVFYKFFGRIRHILDVLTTRKQKKYKHTVTWARTTDLWPAKPALLPLDHFHMLWMLNLAHQTKSNLSFLC